MGICKSVMSTVRQRLQIQSSIHLHSILPICFQSLLPSSNYFFPGLLAPCEIALTSSVYNAERRKRKVAAAKDLAYG